jgi:disulfide oxidoreductase YuzD
VLYHDVSRDDVRAQFAQIVEVIQERGLLYPVTVVNGEPVYDGAVSYPTIMTAIQQGLTAATETA